MVVVIGACKFEQTVLKLKTERAPSVISDEERTF